jgi:hypothetical protein
MYKHNVSAPLSLCFFERALDNLNDVRHCFIVGCAETVSPTVMQIDFVLFGQLEP